MSAATEPTASYQRWLGNVAADYRSVGNAELLAEIESLQYDLAETGCFDPIAAEVVLILAGDRLKLAESELSRRERIATSGNAPNPDAANYQAWRILARDIRDQADVADLLIRSGHQLTRGRSEFYGPCPLCAGTNRFRAWSAADGKRPGYWCRRCGISGDAISAYRAFLVPGSSFFDAVRVLALELGLRTPDFGTRDCSQPIVGTIPNIGSSARENDSSQVSPLGEGRFGNNPRRPAVRFERGRAVAS